MKRITVCGMAFDHKRSRGCDDAVLAFRRPEGWTALISVADVSAHVPVGSAEDRQASERMLSRYEPEFSPMLPWYALIKAALSDTEQRLAVTFRIDLDESLEVTGFRIDRTRLVMRAFSYESAYAALENPDDEDHEHLRAAHELAVSLFEKRARESPEEYADLFAFSPIERPGFLISQELMLLANRTAAHFLARRGREALWRNYVAGDATAHYSSVCRGHAGLKLERYATCTSPLRKFSDLVTQRILLAAWDCEEPPYALQELSRIAESINEAEAFERHMQNEECQRIEEEREWHRRQEKNEAIEWIIAGATRELDEKDFHRALCASIEDGFHTKAFLTDFLERLWDNRLPLESYLALFALAPDEPEWQELVSSAISCLYRYPGLADEVLRKGRAEMLWEKTSYIFNSSARSLDACSATVKCNGRFVTARACLTGESQGDPKDWAEIRLLAALAGLAPDSVPQSDEDAAEGSRADELRDIAARVCEELGWELAEEGFSRNDEFLGFRYGLTVTASAGEARHSSPFRLSPNRARRDAYRALLEAIRRDGAAFASLGPTSRLRLACALEELPEPRPEIEKYGSKDSRVFRATWTIKAGEKAYRAHGSAPSQPEAIEMAASALFETLHGTGAFSACR